jgi:hypothetical protein
MLYVAKIKLINNLSTHMTITLPLPDGLTSKEWQEIYQISEVRKRLNITAKTPKEMADIVVYAVKFPVIHTSPWRIGQYYILENFSSTGEVLEIRLIKDRKLKIED